MIDLIKGKEVLVVGLARSGVAAVELLASSGAASVTVTDLKEAADLKDELNRLARYSNVSAHLGANPPELVNDSLALIVASPGVPPSLGLFKEAYRLGVPVISEIELAYAFLKAPLIGITGTNGKTTTTALIAAILESAGFQPIAAAGNIGSPLCKLVGKFSAQGYIVAELSSFQLDRIVNFRPFISVILNFEADHLDYHGSIDSYFEAKARIVENQLSADFTILNAADDRVRSLQVRTKARVIWFDCQPVELGVGVDDEWLTIYNPGEEQQKICHLKELSLPGDHNLENCLAAAAAAWVAGADPEAIGNTLKTFAGIEHRLEHVLTLDNIDYINDSKGTNPGATIKAIKAFPDRQIILIAGGMDKGADFTSLAAQIKSGVKSLVLIGETKEKIAEASAKAGFNNYYFAEGLDEALAISVKHAESGDLVLLSPACASWDMFRDYEERGRIFKELVRALNVKNTDGGEEENGR